MRVIALLFSLTFLAATAFWGHDLWQRLQAPADSSRSLVAALPADTPEPANARPPSRSWPALFGEFARPEPQPPQPPSPPMPPIESLGYQLKGVVSNGDARWAIVTHPTGDVILKVGDSLVEGVKVDAIDDEGVWLTSGKNRVLLGFERHSP